ncbi:unnamed protein product [Prorocentrum cordatum]|uniref:Uncharacterized protein n=1 Tax=Prorocentrum cordatum TaxID=2364126 RepID=A0ABN9W338_9DINO|nr:unnamed protein product [Polarella glacialis]
MAELVDHVSTGALGRALVSGIWELSPGLAHPRGLTGCAFLASYEVTSLLNLDLCSDGVHAPLRWFCPEACGCDPSYSMSQCPVACILPECLTEFAGCAHVHPWFSDECLAGYDNAGGQPTCKKCTGGATRRRRATSCTDCPEGFFDDENVDDCERCLEGATRRRRSESCTDCGPGSYDAGDSDECTPCPGGATTRRRSTSCVECAAGSYSEGGVEDDCQPCMGVSTSRRRAANVSECPPSYYNDGSSDDCSQCGGLGGETRRRRAESCTACQKYASSEGEDGCSPVDCPSDATGESVSAGCWCGTGFSGSIRATTESPYYSGECVELPFYIRTSGFCPVPILNADLCAKAAQVVGLRATYDEDFVTDRAESWVVVDDDYIPGDYSSEPSGCYETPDDGSELFINAVGENACSSSYRCICLGYENEFACTDLSGSIGGAACPDTGNISFQATTDCDDVDRWSCCGCGGGELEKPNNNGCVDTDGLSLRAPITEGTPGQAESFEVEDRGQVEDRDATPSPSTVSCLQWDWAPHTCQWASYYDSEDFTATDMCCSCGGGTYETETHSETTRTTTETTTEATNGTTNWTITETTTETTTNANVTIGGPL